MAEAKKTISELASEPKIQKVLDKYETDRNKDVSFSYEDSLKEFLDDYRFMQNNTAGAASFINYINGIEDEEYKKELGTLYNAVDKELEDLSDGLAGVGKILLYNVADPINLLGLGAGKVAASTVARPIIKGLVNQSLTQGAKSVAKKRAAVGAAGAAAIEAPIAAVQEYGIQEAEVGLGPEVREEISAGEIAAQAGVAGAFSGVLGGAIGYFIDPYKLTRKAIETMEAGEQGAAARQANLSETRASFQGDPASLDGLYVTVGRDTPEGYDEMGRVIKSEGDTVTIEFLAKDPTDEANPSKFRQDYNLTDAKALSAFDVQRNAVRYIEETKGGFFDTDKRDVGKAALRELENATGDPGAQQILGTVINGELQRKFNSAVADLVDREGRQVIKYTDVRFINTEKVASVLENIEPERFDQELSDVLNNNGLTAQQFAEYYRGSVSLQAANLASQNKINFNELSRLTDGGPELDALPDNLATQYKSWRDNQARAKQIQPGFVDLWRSFLVTQPATTMRNIIGSAFRVPGFTARAALDRWMINSERQLQGLAPSEDLSAVTSARESIDLIKYLVNPSDAFGLVQLYGNSNAKVKNLLVDSFDDRLPIDASEASASYLKPAFKASKFLNTLNAMQDRSIKSSAFLAELNTQISRAKQRGAISNDVGTIEDVIARGTEDPLGLSVISDEMVEASLKAAYDITYQSKNAGDKLLVGKTFINDIQNFLNNKNVAKLVIPFPNFIMNSFVYTLNRAVPFQGIIKAGIKGNEVRKAKRVATVNRQEYNSLRDRTGELSAREKTRLKELENFFGKAQTDLQDVKDGLLEQAAQVALFGTAFYLRNSEFAGEEWNKLRGESGEQIDLSPLFPLTPFLFLADVVSRWVNDVPQREGFLGEFKTILTSLEGRMGALDPFLTSLEQQLSSVSDENGNVSIEAANRFGAIIGSAMGGLVGGFMTPVRPIEDILKTTGDEARKQYIDARRQKDLLVENGIFTRGEIETSALKRIVSATFDDFMKHAARGTPFERAIFDETETRPSLFKAGPVAAPSFPGLKQLTGTTLSEAPSVIEREIDRLGIKKYLLGEYTEVPEYDAKVNEIIGKLAEVNVPKLMNSSQYRSLSNQDKKTFMLKLFGAKTEDVPEFTKDLLYGMGIDERKNLKSDARKIVEKDFPALTQFKKLKAKFSKEDQDKIRSELSRTDPRTVQDILDGYEYRGEGVEEQWRLDGLEKIMNEALKRAEAMTSPTRLLSGTQ